MSVSLGEAFVKIDDYFSSTLEWLIREKAIRVGEKLPLKSEDYLSVSSLPYMCPREEALCLLSNHTRNDTVDSSLRLIFETGNAFQDIFRDIIAPAGTLLGMWRCKHCDYVHGSTDGEFTINARGAKESTLDGRIKVPQRCGIIIDGYGTCEGTEFEYIEETIIDEHFRIKGHPDGFIANKLYDDVLELKTINDYGYKKAKDNPVQEHIEQASWYAYQANKKHILLVYFNKNGGAYKVHRIKVDKDLIERMINKIRAIWAVVHEFESTGSIAKLPDKICDSVKNSKAKRCEMCEECFLKDM